MMMERSTYTVAVIGLGPRGSHALECLAEQLDGSALRDTLSVLVFEDAASMGAGPVYGPSQPESNWINVAERVLVLKAREELNLDGTVVPGFPSYHEWASLAPDSWPKGRVDTFPPRSQVGRYLHQRCMSLVEALTAIGLLKVVRKRITGALPTPGGWSLEDTDGGTWSADEVLLAVGHQPTRADEQMTEWTTGCEGRRGLALFEEPYPVSRITSSVSPGSGGDTVFIRGYGLAMMDVVRALALERGEFTQPKGDGGPMTYRYRERAGLKVAPFSLDGLPMGPKPLNAALDASYVPSSGELERLSEVLSDRSAQKKARDDSFLVDAITPIAARVYEELEARTPGAPSSSDDIRALVCSWLHNPEFAHRAILDRNAAPTEAIDALVQMAIGKGPVSLDYCVGQVWRHCQHTIYDALRYSALPDETMASLVALDGRLKRYAFGPPVESMQQLLALAESGVLVLDHVADPDIQFDESGWTLGGGASAISGRIMVNSVLDNPELQLVTSTLVRGLLEDDQLEAIHDGLGIHTRADSSVVSRRETDSRTLSAIGRLVKGTVLGVDAITVCFGDEPRRWASAALERFKDAVTR